MASSKKKSVWRNYLFLGTHGHVIAVNKKDGEKVWSISLPRTGYSVVSILFEDGMLSHWGCHYDAAEYLCEMAILTGDREDPHRWPELVRTDRRDGLAL